MITVTNNFMADKFLEFNIFAESKSVDVVLSTTKMLEEANDMEISLDKIKVSTDDGTEICNIDNVIQFAITKELKDITLTGNNTIYILDNDYDKYKKNLEFTLTENKQYIDIKGVSQYEKYINLMSKLKIDNPNINIFYSSYIEMGSHYIKKYYNSTETLPVCMLVYDKEYPEDDNDSKLLAVIVTEEMNGINNEIYQIERGV